MKTKCLYCYQDVDNGKDFHDKCSMKFFGSINPPKLDFSIDQLAELAKKVVERSVSVPGVQPKLSMSLVKKAKQNSGDRLTVINALGGQFILKPPSKEFKGMPENEHLTMKIAEAYNINTVPSSLIRLASGELCYISRRIDRTNKGEKIHMLDMFQITEAFDKYKSSMEKVGKALKTYSQNTLLDMIFYFELSIFSFLTGNNDMHLKNFSMIKADHGWVLAPAYDLLNVSIILPEDQEELALTLDGKKKKLKKIHFEQFGEKLGLTKKQIQGTFQRMIRNKDQAYTWIANSFLSEEMKKEYINILNQRYMSLE